ncbi:UNVERIFIED_CONTAM: hypothetical protein RMT77_016624 [Armadillidium vulgare]
MMQVMQTTFQADFRLNKMSVELNNMKRNYARKVGFEEDLLKLVTELGKVKNKASAENREAQNQIREFRNDVAYFQRGVSQQLKEFEAKLHREVHLW